jgi:hypothetical protein
MPNGGSMNFAAQLVDIAGPGLNRQGRQEEAHEPGRGSAERPE